MPATPGPDDTRRLTHQCPRCRADVPAREATCPQCGVDLALVKMIIEAHQSTIAVESEPGKGSRFSFDLKVAGG